MPNVQTSHLLQCCLIRCWSSHDTPMTANYTCTAKPSTSRLLILDCLNLNVLEESSDGCNQINWNWSQTISDPNLWEVSRATAVAQLTYACSAWWVIWMLEPNPEFNLQWKISNVSAFCLKMSPSLISSKNKITIFSLKVCLMKTMYYINSSHLCEMYHTLFVLKLMAANCLSQTQPWEKTSSPKCYIPSNSLLSLRTV